jgi:hypothetical protein
VNLAVTHPTTIADIVFALAIIIVMMTMMATEEFFEANTMTIVFYVIVE